MVRAGPAGLTVGERRARLGPAGDLHNTFRIHTSAASLGATSSTDPYLLPLRSARHGTTKPPKKRLRAGDLKPGISDPASETPDDLQGGDGEPQARAPGSLSNTWVWLKPNALLLISGLVWDVAALAKHLKVGVASTCWPFQLNRRLALRVQGQGFLASVRSLRAQVGTASHGADEIQHGLPSTHEQVAHSSRASYWPRRPSRDLPRPARTYQRLRPLPPFPNGRSRFLRPLPASADASAPYR